MIIGIPGTLYNRILTLPGLFLSLQPFSSQFLQIKGSIDWHRFNPIIPRIICWASFVCMHLSYFSHCSFVFVHFLQWKIQIWFLEIWNFWLLDHCFMTGILHTLVWWVWIRHREGGLGQTSTCCHLASSQILVWNWIHQYAFEHFSSVILLISVKNLQQSWLIFSVELKPGSADDSRSVDRPCDLTVDEQQTEVDFLSTQLFLSFPWPQLQYLSQGLMEFNYLSRWHCGRLQSHLLCLEVTSATWMIQLLLCSRMYLFSKWMPTPLVTHRY